MSYVKTAIITGSTRGIGLGIAKVLFQKGYNVLLHGLDDIGHAQHLITEIEALKKNSQEAQQVHYCQADLARFEDCYDLIDEGIKHFKNVDILVNNGGIQYVSSIEEFPEEQWEKVLKINLSAAFYTVKKLLPFLRKQGWGRIINIASAHGLVGSAHKSAYVAAKHGLVGFTKTLALETAGSGITANAICPGWVLTPLVQKQIEQKMLEHSLSLEEATHALLNEKQPSGQFVTAEELGETVAFLASGAACQITGTTLSVDGGWTAR
jgi:3-hydroxybutyrate dehydrogenase